MSAEPRWMTPRRPERETLGHRVNEVFKRVHGSDPMPWQQHWNLVRYELIEGETGPEFAYPKAIATVPRQSGKTAAMIADAVDRGTNWERPQTMTLTQQRGKDAVRTVVDKWGPTLQRKFGEEFVKIARGNGHESLTFSDGSSLIPLPPTADAGHGETLDLALVDEAWAYKTGVVEAAVGPAQLTIPTAQLVVYSTRGTEESLYLDQQVELGREAVDLGIDEGLCYLEFSAPEDADPDDEDVWRACMPALGYTQTIRKVRAARQAMANQPGEFERAYLNIPQKARPPALAIKAETWAKTEGQDRITGDRCWALSTGPDRSSLSIAVAGWRSDGNVQLLVMECRAGVGWAASHLERVLPSGTIALDKQLDGSLIPELQRAGLAVREMGTADAVSAYAKLLEYLEEGKAVHAPHPALDDAAANAIPRPVRNGNGALFKRYGGVDISPLVACSLALWALISEPLPEPESDFGLIYTPRKDR